MDREGFQEMLVLVPDAIGVIIYGAIPGWASF